MEQTLSIIKPDAVEKNVIGNICALLEKNGLKIVAIKMVHLSLDLAKKFYEVHVGKAFYEELVHYMSKGPIVVQVLEGKNAVEKNRQVMGATDPKKAEKGTIRALYGTSVGINAVHGSDSLENAKIEIAFFFQSEEIFSRP